MHALKVKKLRPGDPKSWEENAIEEPDIAALREEREAWARRKEAKEKKETVSSSTSGGKKKKKKKKKAKDGGEEESPAKKKQKVGGKAIAKKGLEALYAGTGLDPCPRNQKRLIKKTKRALKKGSDTSSSGTSSSSSSGSSEEETATVLQDRSISTLAPGLLSSSSLEAMKGHLAQVAGTGWEEDKKNLPPLLSLYNRVYVAPRLSGGVAREFTTLSFAGDLLIEGRPGVGRPGSTHEIDRINCQWQSVGYQPKAAASDSGKGKSKGKGKDKGKEKSKRKQKTGEGAKTS